MQLTKLFTTCFLTACLSTIVFACGGDDGGTETETNAGDGDGDGDGDADTTSTETGPSSDADCATFCVAYVELCLANGLSDEFATNDECMAACDAWDQAGKNCRYEQIPDACDQAGNNGTACN